MSEFMPVLENEQDLSRLLEQEIPSSEAFDAMSDREFNLLLIAAKERFGVKGTYLILTYLQNL